MLLLISFLKQHVYKVLLYPSGDWMCLLKTFKNKKVKEKKKRVKTRTKSEKAATSPKTQHASLTPTDETLISQCLFSKNGQVFYLFI